MWQLIFIIRQHVFNFFDGTDEQEFYLKDFNQQIDIMTIIGCGEKLQITNMWYVCGY